MNHQIALNKNHLVRALQKPQSSFTRQDIISYIIDNDIEMVNFMYPASDGRLKTLNFVINDLQYLETILTLGERVDGSSLFPFISAGSSDLYVIPRYRTAFLDPFADIPTVTMLCSFCDKDGKPLESSPEHTLHKACEEFTKTTGLRFQAMGELEYYVIDEDTHRFPATDQKGYHESAPFAKFNDFRVQAMHTIASLGAHIKYGHSEVGNFTLGGMIYEQNEIEFLPGPALSSADHLMLAKWVIRNLASIHGLEVTFAPKISVGKAGSGFHIHMRLMKDGKNVTQTAERTLSDDAKRAIAGLMKMAPAITAFGNCNPTSYLRLVPHQEAPTAVCWGDRNRSVLVRVPLGWTANSDMCAAVNPGESTPAEIDPTQKQTVEIRSADGSADVYQLLAGLAVALRYGFEVENALEVAERTYVDVNIHDPQNRAKLETLASLPVDCASSADAIEAVRNIFEDRGVFSTGMIDGIIAKLRSYDPAETQAAHTDPVKMQRMVEKYFHC